MRSTRIQQRIHFLLALLIVTVSAGESWATKYAGEPYYLGVGGRALGRGGAFVASRPDASSAFWNIATLAALRRPEIMAQHAETFGSLLNHDFVAFVMPASDSTGWAWGAYMTYLGGGGIQITALDTLTGRPVVTKTEHHADWSFAFGLARRSHRWWSWGVTLKTVMRDLPGNFAYGLGVDAAWWGQGRGWRAGVKVADLTTTFLAWDSGRKETIVPHVNWGGEIDLPQMTSGLRTLLAAEAETYFEGRKTAAEYWSGSVSVDLHLGFEASYHDLLFARVGSDAGHLALGAGFASGHWGVDAAMMDHKYLDNSYRISLRYLLR
jgi:hypothetical protein